MPGGSFSVSRKRPTGKFAFVADEAEHVERDRIGFVATGTAEPGTVSADRHVVLVRARAGTIRRRP